MSGPSSAQRIIGVGDEGSEEEFDEPVVPESDEDLDEAEAPEEDDVVNEPTHSVFGVSPFVLALFHDITPPALCRHVVNMAGRTDSVEANR